MFLLFSGTDFKYLPPVSATATVTNLIPALLPASATPQPHHHATRTLTLVLVPNKPQSSDFYSYSRSPFSGNLGHLHTPHSPYFPSVSVYGGNWDPLYVRYSVSVSVARLCFHCLSFRRVLGFGGGGGGVAPCASAPHDTR